MARGSVPTPEDLTRLAFFLVAVGLAFGAIADGFEAADLWAGARGDAVFAYTWGSYFASVMSWAILSIGVIFAFALAATRALTRGGRQMALALGALVLGNLLVGVVFRREPTERGDYVVVVSSLGMVMSAALIGSLAWPASASRVLAVAGASLLALRVPAVVGVAATPGTATLASLPFAVAALGATVLASSALLEALSRSGTTRRAGAFPSGDAAEA